MGGLKHGIGYYEPSDGSFYRGDFKNGARHGNLKLAVLMVKELILILMVVNMKVIFNKINVMAKECFLIQKEANLMKSGKRVNGSSTKLLKLQVEFTFPTLFE